MPVDCCAWLQGVSTDPEKLGPKAAVIDGKNVLQLLNHCNGSFRPGILTALVGSSGAGKTTLMDVLAGRKTSEPTQPHLQEAQLVVILYAQTFATVTTSAWHLCLRTGST